jgi:hypothetical protein
LDVGPSCEAAARGSVVVGRDKAACMGDERTAQDEIIKHWSQFAPADKTQCVGMVRTGGPPSYVELQSCLEMMRDVKSIRKDEIDRPLLDKGELNTSTLVPTDLDEGSLYPGGGTKVRRGHRGNHHRE